MEKEEIYKLIPKQFRIANHTIKVNVEPCIISQGGETLYGQFNDAKLTIRIAQGVKVHGEVILLKKEQILNSFYHELFHCFRFFSGFVIDPDAEEMLVQSFANCLREYEASKH